MNGKKAKAIRKKVYGELSIKKGTFYRVIATGEIIRDDTRRAYRAAKKDYREGRA